MIRQATLYLSTPEDARAALYRVAGRPIAFRTIMAAVRAGVASVGVPGIFRGTDVERAVSATASARAVVTWLEPRTPPPDEPGLLIPATACVRAPALTPLLARGGSCLLAGSDAAGAPIMTVPAAVLARLWPSLVAGAPVADEVVRFAKADDLAHEPTAEAIDYVTTVDEARRIERRLVASLGSAIDTRLDTTFHRRLSHPLSLAAVAAGVTPNAITIASLGLGLVAAWCLWRGDVASALAGLVLYAAAVVLDHADGEVARLTFSESRIGEWLDVAADTIVHAAVVLAMGLAAARVGTGGARLGVIAAVGVVASAWFEKTSPRAAGGLGGMFTALGNRDGFYAMLVTFIVALAVAPQLLTPLMVIVAIGTHAYWIARVLHRLRA